MIMFYKLIMAETGVLVASAFLFIFVVTRISMEDKISLMDALSCVVSAMTTIISTCRIAALVVSRSQQHHHQPCVLEDEFTSGGIYTKLLLIVLGVVHNPWSVEFITAFISLTCSTMTFTLQAKAKEFEDNTFRMQVPTIPVQEESREEN